MKNLFRKIALPVFIFCISIAAFVSAANLCEGADDSHVSTLLESEMLDVSDKNNKYVEFKKNILEDRLHDLFRDDELTLKLRVNDNAEIAGVELTLDKAEKLDDKLNHQLKKYIADCVGIPKENVVVMNIANE